MVVASQFFVDCIDEPLEIKHFVGNRSIAEQIIANRDAALEQEGGIRHEETDAERIAEAFLRYAFDERVECVMVCRVRRPDGSTYLVPYVRVVSDLTAPTARSLTFPGPRGGSFIAAE